MSKNTKKIIAVIALLALIAAAVFAYVLLSPEASAGDKTVTVQVVHGDGSEKEFVLSTDSENLRGALEPEGIISGEEGPYGLFITAVDGEAADDTLQQWWCITKGGETVTTGVEDTMIADGDHYELTLKTGW